ncbi:amino acid adenylation domain-containing protein [Paenibacillus sp. SI8]|uniref:non-ribosomal peptide synthetase n=1 Tax=unclassified Paenibacillus TaxID=185978 RepID=UPI003467322E
MYTKADIKDVYLLSSMQESMLFHYKMRENDPTYFEQFHFSLEGDSNVDLFQRTIQILVDRHEILRTVFVHRNVKRPVQVVLRHRKQEISYEDLSGLDASAQSASIDRLKQSDREKGFDLTTDTPLRFYMLKLDENRHEVIWSFHHIILDGWSIGLLFKQFRRIYGRLKRNKDIRPAFSLQFNGYIKWLEKQEKDAAINYWLEYLEGYDSKSGIPLSYVSNTIDATFTLGTVDVVIEKTITRQLKQLSKQNQVSMNTIFNVLWGIILQKYNNTNDVVFASVVSGRPAELEGIEHIVGMFINSIPVRIKSEEKDTFSELLCRVRAQITRTSDYDFAPLSEIQSQTMQKKDLIDHVVVFENYPLDALTQSVDPVTGLSVRDLQVFEQINYNLNIVVIPAEELNIRIAYNSEVYSEALMERISNQITRLANLVASGTDFALADFSLLSQEDADAYSAVYNNTGTELPSYSTIQAQFEEQARRTPDLPAIVTDKGQWTYEELNNKANLLACYLRSKHVRTGDIIALIAEPSLEMMVGLLGIIKAGAAYLPIDPEFAPNRIEHMLQDSHAKLILCQTVTKEEFSFYQETVLLDEFAMDDQPCPNPVHVNHTFDPLYVIYTSGTTGKPKGVVVTHQNLLNYSQWFQGETQLNSSDATALTSSFAFDLGYTALFPSITSGACLHLIAKEVYWAPIQLLHYIRHHGLTYFKMTPTLYTTLINYPEQSQIWFEKVRFIVLGGEPINVNDVEKTMHQYPHIRIMNHYGPTETTVGCVAGWLTQSSLQAFMKRPTIGTPINNMSVYILDRNGNPLPVDVTGELAIAGRGVSKHYLGNEALTQKKYVTRLIGTRKELVYLTGDLGKRLPNGTIELLGRADNQIKIRGYRVEPGEVKHSILMQEHVIDTYVLPKKNQLGEYELHAYVVSLTPQTSMEWRSRLLKWLPEYMIPTSFTYIDRLPVTKNGKIDVSMLPDPVKTSVSLHYQAPTTKTEHGLSNIWKELLDKDEVGIHDNFFDLGGHSLKAMMLVSRIMFEFKAEVTLKQMFEGPTIRELSHIIEHVRKPEWQEVRPLPVQLHYQTSSSQKRIYALTELGVNSTSYNMPTLLRVEGKLNKTRLVHAFRDLIARHEALRTSFHLTDGEIVQRIHDEIQFFVNETEVNEEDLQETIDGFIYPFQVDCAPLFRVNLIHVNNGSTFLLMDTHHLISDGVSFGHILKDLAALYGAVRLQDITLHYKEFATWQQHWLQTEACRRQEIYWLKQFDGEIPYLNLLTDFERPRLQSFKGDSVDFQLDASLTQHLCETGRETGTTLFMILMAAYQIFLSKYTSQEDIIVGTVSAGRLNPNFHHTVGMFANTLPIRTFPEGHKSVRQYLQEMKMTSLDAFDHQDYPFDLLIERLGVQRDVSHNPLFDTVFVMENLDTSSGSYAEIRFHPETFDYNIAKFDMTLFAEEHEGTIRFRWEYCTDLFQKTAIERMVTHFNHVLKQLKAGLDEPISSLDIVTDEEKSMILNSFNPLPTPYPRDRTITALFEEQVMFHPNKTALIEGSHRVTYRELNQLANRCAYQLLKENVSKGMPVAVLTSPSIGAIAAMLGVLKAGGTYVPIDVSSAQERTRLILKDSGATIIMAEKHICESISSEINEFEPAKLLIVSSDLDEDVKGYDDNLNPCEVTDSQAIAYLMYTSGSTGKPKGNLTSHKSIVRVVRETNYIRISEMDVLVSFSNFAFDGSTFDIYGALLNGAALVLIDKAAMSDMDVMSETIEREKVTLFFLTTALFNTFVDLRVECLKNIRHVLFGGERVSVKHVKRAFDYLGPGRLIHVYGPTESTVFATYYPLDRISERLIPIGSPISNTQVYILSESGRVQPVGVKGEICIAGDGLAKGYLHRTELNDLKFVENPYAPGTKMYRTGDLGRWLPNGNIDYLGRADSQVKIRGFRIEMGEIEAKLLEIPGIKEAIVTMKETEMGITHLIAYFVSDIGVSRSSIRVALARSLPDFMIPTLFVPLESLPLTQNGKINQKVLPEPDWNLLANAEYTAPETEVEHHLLTMWSELLGVEKIGTTDNFFHVGGQSLKAMAFLAGVRSAYGVHVPLKEMFLSPTVKELAVYISKAIRSDVYRIEKAENREYYPVSSAQKRIFAAASLDSAQTHYNIPYFIRMTGSLAVEKLELALQQLLERHEALRTIFDYVEGDVVQRIVPCSVFQLEMKEIDATRIDEAIHSFVKPFDLFKGPLYRFQLVKVAAQEYIFLSDIHHIISDGHSIGVIHRDLTELYQGNTLNGVQLQHKDYATWENTSHVREQLKFQESYWLDEYKLGYSMLNLPTDYPRPRRQTFEGKMIGFSLGTFLSQRIKETSRNWDVTVYTFLLSAFQILMAKYSNQDDLVIGTVTSGRITAELRDLVGMFANTLAIKGEPKGFQSSEQYVRNMQNKVLEAFENQNYPLEQLIQAVCSNRDASRHPLYDVMFLMENEQTNELSLDGVKCEMLEVGSASAKADITLIALDTMDGIKVQWSYYSRLYKDETIQRMHNHLLQIVTNMVERSDESLGQMEWATSEERRMFLHDIHEVCATSKQNQTIVELFDLQAEKTPDLPALIIGDKSMTYRQLQERSVYIAQLLQDKQINVGDRIALYMQRSLDMVAALLGCWRIGSSYVPIDPAYPKERIHFMVKDSAAKLFVTNVPSAEQMLDLEQGIVVQLDGHERTPHAGIIQEGFDVKKVWNKSTVDQLAYIIYTSGTTGNPKGVAVEQGSIANTIQWRKKEYGLGDQDTVLQLFSYAFDGFLTSLFTPLISGSRTVLLPESSAKDPITMLALIREHRVTHFISVPSLYHALLECADPSDLSTVTKVTLAGEKVSSHVVKLSKERVPSLELINEYGPTENSVATTIYRNVEPTGIIPIGKPIAGSQVTILSKEHKLVPIGVEGELCISGPGLAREYLNRPDLSSEKFIEHPYRKGLRMYKSGDSARWLPDGNIEYLGRIDRQIKVRGYRIEPAEIEQLLLLLDDVTDAVLTDRSDDSSGSYLCAYFVASRPIGIQEVRQWFLDKVPDYLIPTRVMQLTHIPVTANGKVDYKALPQPLMSGAKEGQSAIPVTATEAKLADVCKEIFGISTIDAEESFLRLGVDSLQVIRLVAELHKRYEWGISFSDVFAAQTIRELAALVDQRGSSNSTLIAKADERSAYPASSEQTRLYVMQKMNGNSTLYNVPIILDIRGVLDIMRAEQACKRLIDRHEPLRTSFKLEQSALVQIIHDQPRFQLEVTDILKDHLDEALAASIRPFQLDGAPLFRAAVYRLEDDHHILFMDMHHIVVDGISTGILLKDWWAFYEGELLSNLPIQYKDFSIWQQEGSGKARMLEQETYWLELFENPLPPLVLPGRKETNRLMGQKGDSVIVETDSLLFAKLKERLQEQGTTPFMFFLACHQVWLHKWSGNEDLAVGCAVSGRNMAELDRMVGMFIKTLALRTTLAPSLPFTHLWKDVKNQVLLAIEHQEYPFEMLVDKLKIPRIQGKIPLFDVLFEWQPTDELVMTPTTSDLELSRIELNVQMAKFDLSLLASENNGKFRFCFNYNSYLFQKERIEYLAEQFVSLVRHVAEAPDTIINELLPEWDHSKLLTKEKTFIFQM